MHKNITLNGVRNSAFWLTNLMRAFQIAVRKQSLTLLQILVLKLSTKKEITTVLLLC